MPEGVRRRVAVGVGIVLLAVVERMRDLGYPAGLPEEGHTELDAVLDDLQSAADPSFEPSLTPSEPADVHVEKEGEHEDEGDEHEGEEQHGADSSDAPFGVYPEQHCPA